MAEIEGIAQRPTVEELLTITEMAALLKVKKSWLYTRSRMRGEDAMPGILRCGKYLRFSPEVVISYLREKYSTEK